MPLVVSISGPHSLNEHPSLQIVLFKNFYWYLTNTDRAYQSYRAFGSNPYDDRLLMPDGGYIRMTELEKFYENTVNCKADPKEAARLVSHCFRIPSSVRMRCVFYTYLGLSVVFFDVLFNIDGHIC